MSLACDAILFDLDGVLADSNTVVERHLRIWAEGHGVPFERVLEVHHGRPTVETIAIVAPHLDAVEEALRIEQFGADDVAGIEPFPGAHRLLTTIPGERWAIATSGTARIARNRIAHLGLPAPKVFVSADDVARGKPAPEPYLRAAEGLGYEPARCVVIEDAPAGIEAGKAAGATVIAIASTLPASSLAGADVVLARLDDLDVEVSPSGLTLRWRSGPPSNGPRPDRP
jgi:mannitol-1-/sugar-/sorbitol-6-phosphatase